MPTLTLRLDDDTYQRLDRLARSTDRSKSYLVFQALTEYLETNEWQVEEIRKTMKAADRAPASELVEHGEVSAWLESWGGEKEGEPPG